MGGMEKSSNPVDLKKTEAAQGVEEKNRGVPFGMLSGRRNRLSDGINDAVKPNGLCNIINPLQFLPLFPPCIVGINHEIMGKNKIRSALLWIFL